MAKLLLEIVTPTERIFSGEVEDVVVPGVEGELGILPEHCPLLTQIAPGELRYRQEGKENRLAVGEGFVEVTRTQVSILTDLAINEADIDEQQVEEAIRRAEAALREPYIGGEDLAFVQANLEKSFAQLRVKRRRTH